MDEETDEQMIKRLLPKEYQDLRNIFLKIESDALTPYRPYNYRIKLETKNNLGYNLLR